MDVQLFQALSLKMVEEVTLLHLTLKESTFYMMLWHLEASLVEDSLNSVLVYLKQVDGLSLTIVMLNHSSMVKVKDVHSLLTNAAAAALNLMNSVLEATEVALQLEEVVVLAKVILSVKTVDSTIPLKVMIVKMMTEKIMQDSLVWRPMEDQLEVGASQEI